MLRKQLSSTSCICVNIYLPMFFILIFASGGISSGSLCMSRESYSQHLLICYLCIYTPMPLLCACILTSSSSLKTDASPGFFGGSDGTGSLGFYSRLETQHLVKKKNAATQLCSITHLYSLHKMQKKSSKSSNWKA